MRRVYCEHHEVYEYRQAYPPLRPTLRDVLRDTVKLIVGVGLCYGAAIVYFAAAWR